MLHATFLDGARTALSSSSILTPKPAGTSHASVPAQPLINCAKGKAAVLNMIDSEEADLRDFLQAFLEDHDAPNTTTESVGLIRRYLSDRTIRSVEITPSDHPGQPSVTSLMNSSNQGPWLVMNGLLPLTSAERPASSSTSCSASSKAGTAAMVAAYAYLHAMQNYLRGSIVLVAAADDDRGSRGGLEHLLNFEERRELFRGDCVLESSPTAYGKVQMGLTNASSGLHHPLGGALAKHVKETLKSEVDFVPASDPSFRDLWRDLDIPTYSFGMMDKKQRSGPKNEAVDFEEFLSLVKVYTLTAWDYVQNDAFQLQD